MNIKAIFHGVLAIAVSPLLVHAQAPNDELKEKMATWKGQRVIFRSRFCVARPALGEEIRGKTGVISEIAWIDNQPQITITLDGSATKITTKSEYCLGFFAEKEFLEKLAGRTLWSKGYIHDLAGNLAPLTKLKVSRLDWSWGILKDMNLVLSTDQGREVGLGFRVPVRPCVISTFCVGSQEKPWDLANEFFEQDPRVLHRDWSADMFATIAQGTVAQGMTEDMVKAACGRYLTKTGILVSPGGKSSPTYTCNGYNFVIDDGKVTKSEKREF